VAAYGAGLSRTVLASYTPALYAAGVACILAAVSILLVRSPARVARSGEPYRLASRNA
jgi:hypothetical protein